MKKLIFLSLICSLTVNTYAQIVYTDIEPDITTTLDPDMGSLYEVYPIDFDNDGNKEFDFRWDDYSSIGYGYFLHITYFGIDNHMWLSGNANSYGASYLQVVNENELIGPNIPSGSWGDSYPEPLIADNENMTFQQQGDKFIGVRITLSGIVYFGWIRVSFDENKTLTVKDYAYQSFANTPILAGASVNIQADSLHIEGENGVNTILNGNTLQMVASIFPSDATTNQNIDWFITDLTGSANISNTGLLTAISSGTVIVNASLNVDGTNIIDTDTIHIEPNLIQSINVSGSNNESNVFIGQTLQMNANISPNNADNQNINWAVINQSGSATINNLGLLTGVALGDVIVMASTTDGSNLTDTTTITIVPIVLESITIYSENNISDIDFNESEQMGVIFSPTNATFQDITWSIINQTASATITQDGLVNGQAIGDGIVQIVVVSDENNMITDTFNLYINYKPITNITVFGEDSILIMDEETDMQMIAIINPSNATHTELGWSVENQTGEATIDDAGILTAISYGTVKVTAHSADESGIIGDTIITINEIFRYITSIPVQGENGINTVPVNSYLQMEASVLPQNATNPDYAWTVINSTGSAFIDDNGLLSPTTMGEVIVKAVAQDGSNISGEEVVNITTAVGINSFENQHSVVYPNPTYDFLNVSSDKKIIQLSLYSIDGKKVMESDYIERINLKAISKGNYILKVLNKDYS
jgi:uncharacterized protein YjdB